MSYTPVPDTPLLDTLFAMAGASIDRCDLSDRELMIARIAALAACLPHRLLTRPTPQPQRAAVSPSKTPRRS